MKFLMWIRRIFSIVFFLLAIVSVIMDVISSKVHGMYFAMAFFFILGIVLWPNRGNYCSKCGRHYDEDKCKLIRTEKNIKKTSNGTKTTYTHHVKHICTCFKCDETYSYEETRRGGYLLLDDKGAILEDKTIPYTDITKKKASK